MLTDKENPYEGVPDDRTHIQKQLDADWRPVPPAKTGGHQYDNQIEEFNRIADEQSAPREANPNRRIAGYFSDMKEKELAEADAAADAAEHLESVQPKLDKIRALREQMLADKECYVLSDFIALDKAEKLYSTPGCGREANQFYQHAAKKAALIVDHVQQQRDLRIAQLEAEIQQLRTVPKFAVQVESEPEADESEKRLAVKRAAIKRHTARVNELIQANRFSEAEELMAQGWQANG